MFLQLIFNVEHHCASFRWQPTNMKICPLVLNSHTIVKAYSITLGVKSSTLGSKWTTTDNDTVTLLFLIKVLIKAESQHFNLTVTVSCQIHCGGVLSQNNKSVCESFQMPVLHIGSHCCVSQPKWLSCRWLCSWDCRQRRLAASQSTGRERGREPCGKRNFH